jgi:eukaryotic-like serine/threonine-protein kinase
MVGQTIGKYRVIEQIGRGGMGTVYKAIDETLDRRVAIKLLNADLIDQDAVERFRREAMMLAKLNHGRIGAIHELTRDGHDFLMVMEFLEGETFEKLIERGPMPVPRAISLMAQVLDALEYAHRAGVIHRDLKPANLMLSPSGEVKVMDFGIARVQGSEHLTTNGYMVGTPAYMAPEQVRGEEVDPRMDLYSAAVVLYRMLTHHLPFHGDTAIAMIHSQLNNPPTPPQQFRTDLPEWLIAVLERGLAKKPADRFQTAREFRTAMEKGLTGKMPVVKPPGAGTTPSRPLAAPPATRNIPGLETEGAPAASTSSQTASGPRSATAPSPSAVVARAGETSPGAIVPPSAAAANATVTLKPRHLATGAVLVLALVIGGGVLAFIALRRPTTVVIQAPTSSASQAAANAEPPAAAPPAASSEPTTPTTPAQAATGGTATPATPPASASGASRPAVSSAPSTSGPASTSTATTARGNTARANSSTAPTRATAPKSTGPGAAEPAAPAQPAAASAPAENFGDIKALVFDGSKSREVDALLSLEPGNLIVRGKSDGAVLRTVPYTAIAAATYARGRRPRGQTLAGASNLPDAVGGSGLFGGARHWLTLQTSNDYVIIRLDDRNVIRVLNGLEARTGSKIMRTQGN